MSQSSSKTRVLIVEDNEDVRNIISIYLNRNGYAIREAADGLSALEEIESFKPDVILLDVLLPKLDGIETLKRLRAVPTPEQTPVIMMSAVLQTKDLKAETARLEVSSFLQKPFQMRTVIEHIENALMRGKTVSHSYTPKTVSTIGQKIQMKRQPFATSGKLETISIPEILHGIFVESRTGQLQVSSNNTEKSIYFQNGMPVYAQSSIPEETLGAHLVEKNIITQVQHKKALAQMTRTGRHFGEILLKLGLMGPHDLFTEIESHLMKKVISVFNWSQGVYHFEDGDGWKDDVIVARMKAGRILLDGIQQNWSPARIQEKLNIGDHTKTFALDASPYHEDQLSLSTQETRILRMARRGFTITDMVQQVKNLNLVTATLFALYIMEQVGFVLTASPATQQFSATGQREDDRAKALLAEYIKLRTVDYFQLLGVTRNATKDEVTNAFKARQQRYHPDTLVGIDTGLIHEKVEELYVRIHNAYRTLIDPTLRKRYIDKLDMQLQRTAVPGSRSNQEEHDGRPKLSKQEHATLFDEGIANLRKGDFAKAHALFEQAHSLHSNPRYEAYLHWATYLDNPKENEKKTEKKLLQLFKQHPQDVIYAYLLGNLSMRQKENKKAISWFMKAIEIDPQHIDSVRQLRLLRMRQGHRESSGLFDLFKKR